MDKKRPEFVASGCGERDFLAAALRDFEVVEHVPSEAEMHALFPQVATNGESAVLVAA